MYRRTWFVAGLCLAALYADPLVHALKPGDTQEARARGKQIYERSCIYCHGSEGRGDGPDGWFVGRFESPRPRDFTSEGFKLRSTESGSLPTDQDLFRVVTQGIPGYMPSFAGLPESERWQVIAYLKTFNPAFKEETIEPLLFGQPSFPPSDAGIEEGRRLYQHLGCINCHGSDGKGDGVESLEGNLKDVRGLRLRAADLTERSTMKNGSSARDIYRTLMTGMDGTPMPSYANQFQSEGKDDRAAWHLVHYILTLSQERVR